MKGTIVTLGGGGFSYDTEEDHGNSLLDAWLLELTGKEHPRVCFVPTASGDSIDYAERFERAFAGKAETSVLTLFNTGAYGYLGASHVVGQDLVYVGGGSTANLLAIWRLHGLDKTLEEAAANGTVLAGISAGMNCWYDASSTDSWGPLAPLRDGLGLLRGSACPHYFGEEGRAEKFRAWIADGELPETGYAADDHVALHWRDGVLVAAVSEQPDRRAFTVTRDGETPIPVSYLG